MSEEEKDAIKAEPKKPDGGREPKKADKPAAPAKPKPEKKKKPISKVTVRKISQALILILGLCFTYLFYSSPMSLCVLDPLWHLQALIADAPNLDLSLHVLQGTNAVDAGSRIAIPSILYLSLFMLLAVLFGRFFCGWICPFGTLLDYLEDISPIKGRLTLPEELKDPSIKYVVLAAFLFVSFIGSQTAFCEFCPAGTVFKGLSGSVIALSIPVFLGVFFIVFAYGRKTWCSYLCPLGAFFGLFSKMHFFGIKAEKDQCVKCFMCNNVCPMDILIVEKYISKGKKINDGDCIKCMNCVDACPRKILKFP